MTHTIPLSHQPVEASLEERNQRLKMLVAELLKRNQELRFKLTALEDEAERLKRGLKNATAWTGMLF